MESHPKENLETPLLINDRAAARLLGISRAHLHRLKAAGKFPVGVHLGRAIRWNRDELAAWVNNGCPDLRTWKAIQHK